MCTPKLPIHYGQSVDGDYVIDHPRSPLHVVWEEIPFRFIEIDLSISFADERPQQLELFNQLGQPDISIGNDSSQV